MSAVPSPPLQPQLARSAKKLPTGDGWAYEPKYNGFRALVFRDGESSSEIRVGFHEIRSARRVRASPILIVVHEDDGRRIETAYFFSRPPPLEAPPPGSAKATSPGRPLGPFAAMRRTSKRRQQRENVRYLSTKAAGLKETIQAWVDEIEVRTRG